MSLPADSRWPLVESLNFVWDINLLDWVPETQPGGSGPTGTVDQGVGGVSAWLVTADSLPLPTGAATGLKQDTGNTSLASIDTKLTSPLTVQATDLDIRNLAFATDKVDVTGSSVTASVTGTVTANAGTNLNTSLLALEAGGNLATVATNTTALVAKDFATETTLALAAAYLLALNTAQGAASDGVVGPLVQSLVNDSPLSLLQGTVQPLSLTSEGRLRVSSVDSYFDKIWEHTFEDVWGTSLTTVANSDLPFAGEVRYV